MTSYIYLYDFLAYMTTKKVLSLTKSFGDSEIA